MRSGPLRVGQDFGTRYHVLKLLGAGGMGVVYQALDRDLGVEVALKVLRSPPTSARTLPAVAEMQRRFKTELLLARQITHKHVIRIHDIGEIGGIRFISMPYVKGGDLATRLKRGPLSIAIAARYARQLVSGLMAVHAAGVIHRDLKPANIMVGESDHVLLMDFGIARSNTAAVAQRTMAGAVVGTLAYMAPEQARGEAVDGRTDIYAFGLILHEMLTGPRPSLTMAEVIGRMKAPPPSVRATNPRIPAALDAIVTKCLQPDPSARYQTALELGAALAGVSRRGRGAASAGAAVPWRWVSRVAAAVLILGLIAGSYEIVRRGVVSDGATRAFALLGSVARQAGHVVRAESAPPVEPVMLDDEVPAFARDAAQTGIPTGALFLQAPAPRSHRWGGWAFLTNLLTIGPRDLWAGYTPAPGAMPMCQAAPRHP